MPAARSTTEPQRRCVGCGRSASKRDLLRLAHDGSRAVPDPAQRLPGRGAYVCREAACIERAVRRGGLARALRRPVAIAAREILAAADPDRVFSHNHLESTS